MPNIGFNRPYMVGKELHYIYEAYANKALAGDGIFTQKSQSKIEELLDIEKSLITHSCTAALEMSALLLNIQPGDEVILPSYTFVSTANAFVLRGAKPVFAEIDKKNLSIDVDRIEPLITQRTKALVPVHYAGSCCDMDKLESISKEHNIPIIEDAAQAFLSAYKGKALGSFGEMSTLSFHETKNIISGEGGALLINNKKYINEAEIIREKGTNRTGFKRKEVDKYGWMSQGSSFLPGEIIAAFLYAQLEEAEKLTTKRLDIWKKYHDGFKESEIRGFLSRPDYSKDVKHNGHMYYILLNTQKERDEFIDKMGEKGIHCVFHYIPLHNSNFAIKKGWYQGKMPTTEDLASRIVRLPFWIGVEEYQDYILEHAIKIASNLR